MTLYGSVVQPGVTATLPPHLRLSCLHDPSGDGLAGLTAAIRLAQALELHSRNVHV